MSKLSVIRNEEKITLDEFFKSMMFQRIMDGDFNRDERDLMLVIFRKTIHFDKWYDHLGIYWLSKAVGICQSKLRKTIKQLEAKGLIEVKRSKGGRTDSNKKFSRFSLSEDFIFLTVDNWIQVKEEQGFYIDIE